MNSNPNDSEFAASLAIVKAAADDRKLVLNEPALSYAARCLPKLRAENPTLSSDDVVFCALKAFVLSEEGIDYILHLARVFVDSYGVLVGKRLTWAEAEGFIPPKSAPMLFSILASSRTNLIGNGKFRFNLGNPMVATPATAAELAGTLARMDVDDNLGEFSKLLNVKPGDTFTLATSLRNEI